MKLYAYSYPGGNGTTKDYKEIEWMLKIHPYFKYRVFYDEESAAEFINRYKMKSELRSLHNYGTSFILKHVDVDYIIYDNTLYINYDKTQFPNIEFVIEDTNCSVIQTVDKVSVKVNNIKLSNRSIIGHIIAIIYILRFAGQFIDLNIKIPDRSIYYALFSYTGENEIIKQAQDQIKGRLGGVSVSLENW